MQRVKLLVLDEVHLLGVERGNVLEVIVSRMRLMSQQKSLLGSSSSTRSSGNGSGNSDKKGRRGKRIVHTTYA